MQISRPANLLAAAKPSPPLVQKGSCLPRIPLEIFREHVIRLTRIFRHPPRSLLRKYRGSAAWRSCRGFEGHAVTQTLQLSDSAAGGPGRLAPIVVVRPGLAIVRHLGQHVVNRAQ